MGRLCAAGHEADELVPIAPHRLDVAGAAERDLQLRRLNYRRDTLEDIFLKAMEV